MKKRFLAIVLALALCMGLAIPALAAATSTDPKPTESAAATEPTESTEPTEPTESTEPEETEPAESTEPTESTEPEETEPTAPEFTDVKEGAYYTDAVKWALTHEPALTNGTSETTFEPETTCTQAQILTFLYRAAQTEGKAAAEDMAAAEEWAKEKGMVGDDFDGSKDCTRATAVSYIWQAFDKPEADKSEFKDVDAEADYAAAVDWAVANGVTNGTDMEAGEFSPEDTCTRGQIVTFLHRAYVEEARLPVAAAE